MGHPNRVTWSTVSDGDDVSSSGRFQGDPTRLYGRWYYENYADQPYEQSDEWRAFFAGVAENIHRQLEPKRVLDVGCAKGFLVGALRDRGVEAYGIDVSEHAIAEAADDVKPFVSVGSLTDPIEGRYDLVTCIEVIEHLDPVDAPAAVANLCAASDRVLLSSTPGDQDEITHVNVQPPERWSQLFAGHGFFRDFRYDVSYLTPWAVVYRRDQLTTAEAVYDYERAWYQLRRETIEQRKALLDMQTRLEELDAHRVAAPKLEEERQELRKELLRLRDALVGREAELGTAEGRLAEMHAMLIRQEHIEKRLDEVLGSRSWRLMWALGAPLRAARSRDGV